jgi:membrane protease subunit HflC
MRKFLLASVLVLLAWAGWSAAYTVDRTEYVYVTEFGRHVATHDGASDGGLHWKWPWPVQSVQRLDRRLQYFDLPDTELLTRDQGVRPQYLAMVGGPTWSGLALTAVKDIPELEADGNLLEKTGSIDKTITVSAFVCWRIADRDGVDRFLRTVVTPDGARALLESQVKSQLQATIGQRRLDDLISTERGKVDASMAEIHRELLRRLRDYAQERYGIEVVDVRLRRTGHPAQVRDSIFARIRSERAIKATRSREEGKAEAERITSQANAEAANLTNEAAEARRRLEEEAKVQAAEIRFRAYSQDRELAEYLIEITRLVRAIDPGKSVLLVSMKELYLRFLRPPGTEPANGAAKMTGTKGPAGGKRGDK